MHYYKFNIGDYASHTGHLDPLEDIAYRRMLDWVYLHESPLPSSVEQVARLIRMRTHSECIANVLREFFELTDYGYIQEKAMGEIEAYRDKSAKAKASARARWSESTNKSDANALQTKCERNANHKPLTTNHKPLTTNQDIMLVLDHLNTVCGRNFSTSKEAEARLKQYTVDDLKTVIEYKAKQWMGTDMQMYLRPSTLFNKTKFEGYWNDAQQQVPTNQKNQSSQQGAIDVLQDMSLGQNNQTIGIDHG